MQQELLYISCYTVAKLYKLRPLGNQTKKNHRLHEWRGSNLLAPFWKIGQIIVSSTNYGQIYILSDNNISINEV